MSTINGSDVFGVQRGSTQYKVAAIDMPDTLSGDLFFAQRGGTAYKLAAIDAPDVQPTDWFAVTRGSTTYKVAGIDFADLFTKPSIDLQANITANGASFPVRFKLSDGSSTLGKIDWDDGSPLETMPIGDTPEAAHVYASTGLYTVRVRLRGPVKFMYNDGLDSIPALVNAQLVRVLNPLEDFRIAGDNSFKLSGQASLVEFTVNSLAEVTNAESMFKDCVGLATFGVSDLSMLACTEFSSMFRGAGTAGAGFSFPGMNLRGLSGPQGSFLGNQPNGPFCESKVLAIGSLAAPVRLPTAQDYGFDSFASNAPNLVSAYFDTLERCTNFSRAMSFTSRLEVFSVASNNMSKCADMFGAFRQAGLLGPGFNFPGLNLRGLSGSQGSSLGNQANGMFAESKVLQIGSPGQPLLLPTAQDYDLQNFAAYATSLTAIYVDTLERCANVVPNTAAFNCYLAAALVTVSVSNPAGGIKAVNVSMEGCSLNQASVDLMLLLCVNGLQNSGFIKLHQGTSATPSATGLGYKATLVSRGWTVVHN